MLQKSLTTTFRCRQVTTLCQHDLRRVTWWKVSKSKCKETYTDQNDQDLQKPFSKLFFWHCFSFLHCRGFVTVYFVHSISDFNWIRFNFKNGRGNTPLNKSAEKNIRKQHNTDVCTKKTMFPIYRKNHIWSSISRSPDLRSLLRNSFPDWRLPLQWIMFRNSLSQWRDRTGIRPVSLLIRVFKIKIFYWNL